jgi:hypothetical protein
MAPCTICNAAFDFECSPDNIVNVYNVSMNAGAKEDTEDAFKKASKALKSIKKKVVDGLPVLYVTMTFEDGNMRYAYSNAKIEDNDVEVKFYVFSNPITNGRPEDVNAWNELYSCLLPQCQKKIGLFYGISSLKECDFLLVALAENNGYEYDSILGFTVLKMKSQSEINLDHAPLSFEDTKRVFNPVSNSNSEPNVLCISLICSYCGMGGRMLSLLQTRAFKQCVRTRYKVMYLESVPEQYSYYILKHGFVRSINAVDIYPCYLQGRMSYYAFDPMSCPDVRRMQPNRNIFKDDDLILTKFVSDDAKEQGAYNTFLNGLQQPVNVGGKAGKATVRLCASHRIYKVYESAGKRYIVIQKQKVYLKDIRGKYRYASPEYASKN